MGIHTYFLLNGSEAFRLPASLVLLLATLVLSLAQALALVGARRHDLAAPSSLKGGALSDPRL